LGLILRVVYPFIQSNQFEFHVSLWILVLVECFSCPTGVYLLIPIIY
jgi:hypothetical protein